MPKEQKIVAEKLTDPEIIEQCFEKWSKILKDQESCANFIECIGTFDRATQVSFVSKLIEEMHKYDQLEGKVDYHVSQADLILCCSFINQVLINQKRANIYPYLIYRPNCWL